MSFTIPVSAIPQVNRENTKQIRSNVPISQGLKGLFRRAGEGKNPPPKGGGYCLISPASDTNETATGYPVFAWVSHSNEIKSIAIQDFSNVFLARIDVDSFPNVFERGYWIYDGEIPLPDGRYRYIIELTNPRSRKPDPVVFRVKSNEMVSPSLNQKELAFDFEEGEKIIDDIQSQSKYNRWDIYTVIYRIIDGYWNNTNEMEEIQEVLAEEKNNLCPTRSTN